jgi:hypothetical protein
MTLTLKLPLYKFYDIMHLAYNAIPDAFSAVPAITYVHICLNIVVIFAMHVTYFFLYYSY